MCVICETNKVGRRRFLKFGAGALAAVAAGAAPAAYAAGGATTSVSSDEALARLKDGNERFVSQPEVCSLDLAKQRGQVAGSQAPWATIISCADSRVPPELIFGGIGCLKRTGRC